MSDEVDSDYQFWIQGDVLAVERRKLLPDDGTVASSEPLAQPSKGSAASSEPLAQPLGAAVKTPAGVKDPPQGEYLVAAVYRFTRSDNDLTNPGMGYGELTQEAAWETTPDGLHLRKFYVRRTRSARRRFPPDKPVDVSTKNVISIMPPPLKP